MKEFKEKPSCLNFCHTGYCAKLKTYCLNIEFCESKKDNKQMNKDRIKLFKECHKFIVDNKISCPESIAQCDHVIENAYEFIENVCNIVGYYDYDTNTTTR